LENAINDILAKLEFFDHHTEHEFASVNDHILNMLGKIEKREDKSEMRIDTIEDVSYSNPCSILAYLDADYIRTFEPT
jgi:hypothetical protein